MEQEWEAGETMARDDMQDVEQLMQGVRTGRLSRRDFIKRAASPTRPGSPGASPAAGGAAGTIKFYSSFPMNSASKAQIDTIVNAYKMALEDVNYKVGNLTIVYDSTTILDDGSPAKNGAWDGAVEAANANKATADADAMVYLGTFNSGAAKVAIPINNRANLVQISPANTYPGLTKKLQ